MSDPTAYIVIAMVAIYGIGLGIIAGIATAKDK